MRLAIIGCGYVGLVTGSCLAELGNEVICVDSNEEKINQLSKDTVPIYESGLSKLIKTNVRAGRLSFAVGVKDSVENSEIIFITAGIPLKHDGSPDLGGIEQAGKQIAGSINGYRIIVVRSTVPIGITHKVKVLMSIFSNFGIGRKPLNFEKQISAASRQTVIDELV